MEQKQIVIITGVADYWGSRVAQRLVDEPDYYVIGLDERIPEEKIEGVDYIQAEVRNRLLKELFASEQVDVVCHLKFDERIEQQRNALSINVEGAANILEACEQAGVGRVILKSSTAVYGATPHNHIFLTEDTPREGSRTYQYNRARLEIEDLVEAFAEQAEQSKVAILRFAHIVGPTANTPMTRFLREKTATTILGFDPQLQLIHEDDVVDALVQAILEEVSGPINVAAEGAMPLTRILSLARKVPLPVAHPLAYMGVDLLAKQEERAQQLMPLEPDYLRYPCIVDLERMHNDLGFMPHYMADEAVKAWRGPDEDEEDGLTADERHLKEVIEKRHQQRQ